MPDPRTLVNILILGDSALTPIGGCLQNAVDLWAEKKSYARPVGLLNGSVLGMTTADALIHLRETATRLPLKAVVIYLGNCDACAFGYLKPRTLLWRNGKTPLRRSRRERKSNPLSRRHPPYTFIDILPNAKPLKPTVSAVDFRKNLEDIVGLCSLWKIKLLLLNPISKANFPPCNNTGNFTFYSILSPQTMPDFDFSGPHQELLKTIELHATGDFIIAKQAYKKILSGSKSGEVRQIALNNLAALDFANDDPAGALERLKSPAFSDSPMLPIVFFNQAVIYHYTGQETKARAAFDKAMRLDPGSYRIRPAYRQAIKDLAKKHKGKMTYIDTAEFLSDIDFVDYCHPSPEGHQKLYERIEPIMSSMLNLEAGTYPISCRFMPLNPDRYAGMENDFFEHFQLIDGKTNKQLPDNLLERAAGRPYDDFIRPGGKEPHEINMDRILRHPLFGCPEFMRLSPPNHYVDQGRFPEFYALRHMLSIYWQLPGEAVSKKLPDELSFLLPIPEKLHSWLVILPLTAIRLKPAVQQELLNDAFVEKVIRRTRTYLHHTVNSEPSLFKRYRTITYWLLRESLTFGCVSHFSMFFQRSALREMLDSVIFLLVSLPEEHQRYSTLERILAELNTVIAIHKQFLLPFATEPYAMPAEQHQLYRQAIRQFADKLPHFIPPPDDH